MTDISRRFEQFIRSANKNLAEREFVIPVKNEQGICVGDAVIKSEENLKTVTYKDTEYRNIFLNSAAIKIANLLALKKSSIIIDQIYQLDQEYGKWFLDNQHLLRLHKKAKISEDHERADMLWARYQESRDRAMQAKIKVERLVGLR
jgi:hypothetical protein